MKCYNLINSNYQYILSKTLRIVNNCGIVILPTETVYGIMASPFNKKNINQIYTIKNREFSKPLAMLCATEKQINHFCYISKIAKKIIRHFCPGPLTLILPARNKKLANLLNSQDNYIGVRIPHYELLLDLIKLKKSPIIATSANLSGQNSIDDFKQIITNFTNNHQIKMAINDNHTKLGISSTVIKVNQDDKIELLRQGSITIQQIHAIL